MYEEGGLLSTSLSDFGILMYGYQGQIVWIGWMRRWDTSLFFNIGIIVQRAHGVIGKQSASGIDTRLIFFLEVHIVG